MTCSVPRSWDSARALLVVGLALLSLRCSSGGPVEVPEPFIDLSESILNFSGTAGAAGPAAQTVAITNSGDGPLTGLATAVSYSSGGAEGWLTVELSSTTAPSTLTVTAATGTLAPGAYTALVMVSSDVAENSPQPVGVNFTVLSAAASATIVLSSTSQNFTSLQGGSNPTAQTVEVSNGGSGTLDGLTAGVTYTPGQPGGWLTAGLSATAAPSTLTLTAAAGSLTAGTYTASVAVGSAAADNSPQAVDVTFTIVPPTAGPIISLSTNTGTFTATQGGADPGARTLQVSNGGGSTLSGLGASISYTAGQPAGWLAAVLTATTAPSTLRLTATTGSLAVGTYTARVEVRSAVASNSPQAVNLTFTISAAPRITLSSTSQAFSVLQGGGNPAPQTVGVSNGGGGTLSGLTTGITYTTGQPTGWLDADLSGTTAPSTLTVTVTTGTLTAGTYEASVAVRSTLASNSPQAVSVTLTVQPPAAGPVIVLSSPSQTFSALQGGPNPAAQTVEVTNGGGGTLSGLEANVTYEAGQPTDWLSAELSATTAPTTLTLVVTTGGLAAGTYNAIVGVASSVADVSPQAVSVTLTVTEAQEIVLDRTSLSLIATETGSNPWSQRFEITNGRDGTLSDLSVEVSYPAGQPAGWLDAELIGTTAPTAFVLAATTGSLPIGTHSATVTVVSPVAHNSPQTVPVTLTIASSLTPLLKYEFEGNLNSTGLFFGGFTGTSGAGISYPPGKFGQAMKLDGTPGLFVDFPHTHTIFGGGTHWTISLWFMEEVHLVGNDLWDFRSPDRGWETYHGVQETFLTTCSDAGCSNIPSPAAGVWHNIMYRYDGDPVTGIAPLQIYVDGELVDEIDETPVRLIDDGVADIAIGRRAPAGSSEFYVDEFRVYDHVFSEREMCETIIGGTWDSGSSQCALP